MHNFCHKTMKIIFIGGVRYSHSLLSHILDIGWNVEAIFSYDESKKKYYSDFICFEKLAKKFDITHILVDNINDKKNIEIIKKINPDLILVMGWSQLLNSEIIKIPKIGTIGSHPTELPKYRGRAPIPWSILKGLKQSALTFFYIQEGVDDGDILDQQKFEISDEDDATSIYEKMIDLGKKMLERNLPLIENGKQKRIKQNSSLYIESWPKRTPDDGIIDWSNSAKIIQLLIRATTRPYPGAFTYWNNKKLIIWRASTSNETSFGHGIIMAINDKNIKIGTGNGCLIVDINDLEFYDNKYTTETLSNISLGQIFKNKND